MRIVLWFALIAMALPQFLPANEIYRFIPRHSQLVLQVNPGYAAAMETVRQDLIRNIGRQAGLDEKNDNLPDLSSLIEKILVVIPDLTVDETCIFVKIKCNEAEFLRKIKELTGINLAPVQGTVPAERRFTIEGNQLSLGGIGKKRTFALAFLTGNVLVLAKDNLSGYRKFRDFGLPEKKRKELAVPKALAAGYAEITAAFLAEYPYLPRIQRAVYALTAGNDGSLQIHAAADCADENSTGQAFMQAQQYIMVGGIVLNQLNPELMQEWMNSVKAGRDKTTVTVTGKFSGSFIKRLADASGKLAGTMNNQPESAGREKMR